MKKYLVIGNPISHSLSPKLHNYWIKNSGIDAIYEKQELNENELEQITLRVKEKKIDGINVTVPFKKSIIPFLDELSIEAKSTQSVNTIYLKDNKVIALIVNKGDRDVYIPTSPSNIDIQEDFTPIAELDVYADYEFTKNKLQEIYETSNRKIPCNPKSKLISDMLVIPS